jgi:arginase
MEKATKNGELKSGEIAVLGIPFDKNSSYKRGPASGPGSIREALFSESTNMWTEKGIDLGEMSGWKVLPDLVLSEGDTETVFTKIERTIHELLKKRVRIVSLGGDHSITYPIIRAYGKEYTDLSILQFDAHPDLYDELDGNRYSHACQFARIMEEDLVQRLIQVGVRTITGHQREQAERFNVEIIDMMEKDRIDELSLDGPVYVSLDMDCLDPAFAPGVSHHEPGGMSTRDVVEIIQNLKGNVVGADLVELNPELDPLKITGMVAGKLLKEILGRMFEEQPT